MPDWRWNGRPGHYEAYYLTTTHPATGTGLWIRHTMLAPSDPADPPTESLWFMATWPDRPALARKHTAPHVEAHTGPSGMRGAIGDTAWDLAWEPRPRGPYRHVHPLLRRGIATTILELPNADVALRGTVTLPGGETLALDGAHGGQAHLWGTKHSRRWTWAHCGDFEGEADTFLDGVSVFVERFGREVGPSTPVVGRLLGDDFVSTSPLAVLRAPSAFGLTSWAFAARTRARRVRVQVDAPRAGMVGVTYADPDGEPAYCYNSETASMRVVVEDRSGRAWRHRATLRSRGCAHFEYGTRQPVPGMELHLT